jgi:creatinine amidohydrolase
MVTEDTGIGNPKRATKEKGQKFFHAVTEKMAELFVEMSNVDISNRYGS